MAVYQRMLLAVDLTSDSFFIGQRARTLAAALDAQLEILHVVEPIPAMVPIPPDSVMPVVVSTQAELVKTAEEQIGGLAHELGVPETRWSVVMGNTRSEIVRAATEGRMDLIVIGSRERHGLAFLIKPTEDVVLHRAPCDVLAVRLAEEEGSKQKKK
jgi:universal stress protein A